MLFFVWVGVLVNFLFFRLLFVFCLLSFVCFLSFCLLFVFPCCCFACMPVPTVWGPAVWGLFHGLVGSLSAAAYTHRIHLELFGHMQRICRYLPCPTCSEDATRMLATVTPTHIATPDAFVHFVFAFHNCVNRKTRKPMASVDTLTQHAHLSFAELQRRVSLFLQHYHTRGNMNQLAESFQRQYLVQEFVDWMRLRQPYFTREPRFPWNPSSLSDSDCFSKRVSKEPTVPRSDPPLHGLSFAEQTEFIKEGEEEDEDNLLKGGLRGIVGSLEEEKATDI